MKKELKLRENLFNDKLWYNPFSEWLGDFFDKPSYVEKLYMKSNIVTNDDDYRIQLAVPGISKDEIKISIEDSILTISHEKNETDNQTFYFTNTFKCKYSLPVNCKEDEITSKLENGVLEIIIPMEKKKIKERYIKID